LSERLEGEIEQVVTARTGWPCLFTPSGRLGPAPGLPSTIPKAACSSNAALDRAVRIATLAPLTLAYSKQVLNRLLEPEIHDPGLDSLFEEVWRSADVAEGHAARRANAAHPASKGVEGQGGEHLGEQRSQWPPV